MKKQLSLFFVSLLSISSSASAMVTIGNGNYFVGFTQLEHDAPVNAYQLKVQCTYNSRSQFDGVCGYGWGTEFEGFLMPSADGSVVIQESGSGDTTRFTPEKYTKTDIEKHLNRLLDEYAKKEKVAASRIKDMREKLLIDAVARDELSRSLGLFPELPVGTKLYSTQRGDKQTVSVIKGGYVREYGDGKQELFNVKVDVTDQGVDPARRRILKGVYKVSRILDPVKKSQIFYTYDKNGLLASVSDKKSQTIRFKYNTDKKMIEASDSRGGKAIFQYCDAGGSQYDSKKQCSRGDMIRSKDWTGEWNSFKYDSLHNLVSIGSQRDGKPDMEFEDITYWPVNSAGQGGVRRVQKFSVPAKAQPGMKLVKHHSGKMVEPGVAVDYNYWQDPKDKEGHYRTEVKTTYSNGRLVNTSYEYFEKKRTDGSRYRYKMISLVDNEKTETIYNECCGQPLQITGTEGVTKFEYYPGTGLPKEKDTPTENIRWEYHSKFRGKITKVTVSDKSVKSVHSSVFDYDDANGQLKKARTSDGKGIVLAYDKQGRIAKMIDQDKRQIVFKYSRASKPEEIIQAGVGSIEVIYDGAGNIKEVKSKGGRQIAVSVAAAFQNLLEIIKPAGIQPI